jgi:membrane protease YdiL (CAAX protease family)
MTPGFKAWIAGIVYTLLCLILGYFAHKKESLTLYIQAGICFLAGLFCSYYAIFWFLENK